MIGPAIVPQRPRREQMMEWSVAQVASFYESEDAAAIGAALAASSVQGADLLSFTVDSVKEDLKVNPFVARKVCQLRDRFLA